MLARCRGVSPFIWYWQMFFFFVSEMSAPRLDFNNALTFFFLSAWSCALTFPRFSRRILTTCVWPASDARCNGVSCEEFRVWGSGSGLGPLKHGAKCVSFADFWV